MRNLTEVSLNNRVLVWYFILVTVLGGVWSTPGDTECATILLDVVLDAS